VQAPTEISATFSVALAADEDIMRHRRDVAIQLDLATDKYMRDLKGRISVT